MRLLVCSLVFLGHWPRNAESLQSNEFYPAIFGLVTARYGLKYGVLCEKNTYLVCLTVIDFQVRERVE